MISKPILIAASVASAQAALMALAATPVAQTVDQYSDAMGCGKCLSFGTASKYIVGGATKKYLTRGDGVTTAIAGTNAATWAITGEICCGAAGTKQLADGSATTFCADLYGNDATVTNNTYIVIAATQYYQSALAQCPHNTVNCTALAFASATDAAFTGPMATAIAADPRLITLTKATSKVGYGVTLSMISQLASGNGAQPSLKQRLGDVCTWVVASECDAPVITVAAATTAVAEWKVQVTEWSGEFLTTSTLTTGTGPTWTTQVGAAGKLHYPPLTATITAAITDLQATAVAVTTPNGVMGNVSFKTASGATDMVFQTIPGNILSEWSTWLASVYASKKADNATYETELAKWVTFLAYVPPTPGLFVPAVDPKAPAKMSKPRAPTQAVDTPSTLANFAKKGTTAVPIAALNLYKNKAGYGYPSAYILNVVKEKTGKPFGTLAGGSQAVAPAAAWATTQNGLSVRKTSNKKADGTYIAACDKSYLMITGVLETAPGAAVKTVELKVTSQEFQKTLLEQIPVRSGAPVIAKDAPAGAAQLAASAVAAALTALYLF